MKVELIASTKLEYGKELDVDAFYFGAPLITELGMELDDSAQDPEHLIEFAGRGCYKSYHKPNEKTRANVDYVGNIKRQLHLSVLEHATVSFYVEDVSRSLTHELIRHRHFSFSQESQRFVTYDESTKPVIHPTLQESPNGVALLQEVWSHAIIAYNEIYDELREEGLSKKQAAEAAREVLPNACPTSLVVSGNLRAWYEFMPKRNSPSADAQIQKFAKMTLKLLKKNAPAVFAEFD